VTYVEERDALLCEHSAVSRRRFLVAQHKLHDFTETAVLPEHLRPDRIDTLADAAAESHGCYKEYVRVLDELPVLVDVVSEPPRVAIKDFRLGQRPDARKAPRDDAAALRERHAGEAAARYAEYAEQWANLNATERAGPQKTGRKPGHKKKRAKRAGRSARSKS
jgi:hypothetical protein